MDFSNTSLGLDIWTFLVIFLVFVVVSLLIRKPRNLPPGPWGWPLLGYLPQLAVSRVPTYEALSELGLRYGPVCSFYLTNQLVVVLQDFDVIKKALALHQLSGRPTFEICQKSLPGHGVVSASGKEWEELRRFSVTTLRSLGMAKSSYEKQISTEAQCLMEEIRKIGGRKFDLRCAMESATANVVCSVLFGKRFEYTDERFIELLQISDDIIEIAGAGGVLEFIPMFSKLTFLPIVKRQIEVNNRLMAFIKDILEDHDTGYEPGSSRDYIDAFYNEMRQKESQGLPTYLNTNSLYYTIAGLFSAGAGTSASTLRWAILYMVAYTEIQKRVQDELENIVGRDRLPQLSDKPKLPYTQAVLSEIQRVGCIAPLSIPHRCLEDTAVSGYHIPKGALIVPNLWQVCYDDTEWTNPREFKPERFLDEEGNFRARDHFVPFGIGRRVCLGENLAKMELFIFFTFLLHQFTFESPEGATGVSFEPKGGITLGPVPYKIRAIPRA
ncbi:cytochrome P450 2J6-like [Patiria miniata]|uniref:Cytochrome P450 n=1 Tax=Patiria miniata TaxID=46514 RepID=A0A914A961_PATMI|nr:cytochrome P450 2J6-like [Patiria miniata]